MDAVTICNDALGLIGHSVVIESIDPPFESAEARSCARIFPVCLAQVLDLGWTFTRRDEVITEEYLTDITSLPWRHTYELPPDVGTILSLTEINAPSYVHTIGQERGVIRFDLRNVDNKRYLVTDADPDFTIHYHANNVGLELVPPLVCQGLEYMIASKLAPEFVKGDVGHGQGMDYLQLSNELLTRAWQNDLAQGAYSLKSVQVPSAIKVRM